LIPESPQVKLEKIDKVLQFKGILFVKISHTSFKGIYVFELQVLSFVLALIYGNVSEVLIYMNKDIQARLLPYTTLQLFRHLRFISANLSSTSTTATVSVVIDSSSK
jgi:hypothetical protein